MTTSISKAKQRRKLFIDIETYSDISLQDCGVYRYVDTPEFEIMLIGYAYDDEDVKVVDLASSEDLPPEVLTDLTNPEIVKLAHNANFERTCLAKYYGKDMPPEQWLCTAARASTLGLPRSLEAVGKALGLAEEEKKMAAVGKQLVLYFSKPCKATKANGGRRRNMPWHAPDKWNLYKEYNRRDVVTERAIFRRLEKFPQTTDTEQALWDLDQKINDGGVLIDTQLVDAVLNYADSYRQSQEQKAMDISKLDNPNSLPQIRRWLNARGVNPDSLDKDSVSDLIKQLASSAEYSDIIEFLQIRQELGKTSVTKYDAISRALCSDTRIRGMLQFYGANRTGRWAGRLVQLQNLPQNKFKNLDLVRTLVREEEWDLVGLLYPSLMEVFSQLIRTCFIAEPDKTFAVADYSAIEARVIAWLAGEDWRLEVFRTHGKIYEASYAAAFKVPIESVKKGSTERKKGKIMELALGYGGGINALKAFGADEMGLDDNELTHLVQRWRKASPHIVDFWRKVEGAAKKAINNPGSTLSITPDRGLRFRYQDGVLFIRLPSGREIAYQSARLVAANIDKTEIRYMGQNQTTQKWEEVKTYGGKLAENITQATARDCLGYAMLALDKAGYRPEFHVHDEVIVPVDKATAAEHQERITEIMALKGLDWVKGLPLIADAYTTEYYRKD